VLWSAATKVKVTITSNCVGIDGDTAMITVTSPEPFAPDSTKPNDTVTTWTVYAYDMPDCTIEIPVGSTILCSVDDSKASNRCYVNVNGVEVLSDPGTYVYTVTKNVSVYVADEYSMGEYGTIVITEQGG
jgi:hypothetical protein